MSGSTSLDFSDSTAESEAAVSTIQESRTPPPAIVRPGGGNLDGGNDVPGISVTSNVVGGIVFVLLFVIVALIFALVFGMYCVWKRSRKRNSECMGTLSIQ